MSDTTQLVLLILQAVSVICFFLATFTINGFKRTLDKVQESISDLNNHIVTLLERDKSKDAQIDGLKDNISLLFDETKQLRERYHTRVNEDSSKIQRLELIVEQIQDKLNE